MLNFIYYVGIGIISGWLFKYVAAVIEAFFIFGFYGVLTGFKGDNFDERVTLFPKKFVFSLVTKNVMIGTLNAIMIFIVTAYFLQETGANLWLYIGLSVIWSLFIQSYHNDFPLMFFMTSTVTLILYWVGFGILATITVPVIVLITSLAYYFGRVEVIMESQGISNDYTYKQ
ncbi:hypothetical protein [Mesobacillus maritimus]|uniref:hypothetical protein n=1 Tax=Mesobacillus maritimus TaxID=1643336 RepID=UPI00384AF18C